MHLFLYSDDAPATRAFLRDVMLLESVSAQHGESEDSSVEDWLIFAAGPCELAVHPTGAGQDGAPAPVPHHSISLLCDDLDETMAELAGRGAVFTSERQDLDWGITVTMQVPGAPDVLLYEPKHVTAYARGLHS